MTHQQISSLGLGSLPVTLRGCDISQHGVPSGTGCKGTHMLMPSSFSNIVIVYKTVNVQHLTAVGALA